MSNTVDELMALAYKHSQLYYDWHNDAVRYKTFEAARAELRAAITTALREQYEAGIAASAGQAATLPEGMVLVPVEPTPGMIDAARACQLTCEYAAIYRTMIAAREGEPS